MKPSNQPFLLIHIIVYFRVLYIMITYLSCFVYYFFIFFIFYTTPHVISRIIHVVRDITWGVGTDMTKSSYFLILNSLLYRPSDLFITLIASALPCMGLTSVAALLSSALYTLKKCSTSLTIKAGS